MPQGLSWYLRRAGAMSPREWAHRIRAALSVSRLRVEQLGRGRTGWVERNPTEFAFCTGAQRRLPEVEWAPGSERTGLDEVRVLARSMSEEPDRWHRAPDTGLTWPLEFFAGIDYRSGNRWGDARLVWEPSRLQLLLVLARAAESGSGDEAAGLVTEIERCLASWLEANPPYLGIHYVSAMECGLRILSVCHALDRVRARLEESTWRRAISLIESHAVLIERRLSLYSSAGNHTLAEAAGLIFAGGLFPELPSSRRRLLRGLSLFEKEVDRQILPDGGGIERSTGYSRFITDLCGLVVAALPAWGAEASEVLEAAWRRGRDFLETLSPEPGSMPQLGDGDGGFALSPHLRTAWREEAPFEGRRTFEETGVTVLASKRARLVFDHGALGMAPLHGHGHADGLAIDLALDGREVFVDCGTGTYRPDGLNGHGWRAYFRGTRAHNTVCVGDEDQAVQAGAFQWTSPYDCSLVDQGELSGRLWLLARLRPAHGRWTHWRGIGWDESCGLFVWDRVVGEGVHELELNWHVPVTVEELDGVGWQLGDLVRLSVQGPGEDSIARGADDVVGDAPGPGWWSRRYAEREPLTSISRRHRGELPCEWSTSVSWLRGESPGWESLRTLFEERT